MEAGPRWEKGWLGALRELRPGLSLIDRRVEQEGGSGRTTGVAVALRWARWATCFVRGRERRASKALKSTTGQQGERSLFFLVFFQIGLRSLQRT